MTRLAFLTRTLRYHWRTHVALALSAAVASSILAGALMLGDSMTASLRELAHERLGGFRLAVTPRQPFRSELASDIAESDSYPADLDAPVAVFGVDASIVRVNADGSEGVRVGRVNGYGVDARFFAGFGDAPGAESLPEEIGRGELVVNATLARDARLETGDTVVLSTRRRAAAPLESFLGDRSAPPRSIRMTVSAIIPDRGAGLFTLEVSQAAPRIAYVELASLQRAIDAEGLATSLLVAPRSAAEVAPTLKNGLGAALREALAPADLGLRVDAGDASLPAIVVDSTRTVLPVEAVDELEGIAEERGVASQRVLTHLAERIARAEKSARFVPHSTVSALSSTPAALGELRLVGGGAAPELAAGELLLNTWAAEDLGIEPASAAGHSIALTYYVSRPDESVTTATETFRLRGVVEIAGLAADRRLTPDFPGVSDGSVKRLRDLDPPFEMDLGLIRDQDEAYWDEYGATPKAFVSMADGSRLFETRYGPATSVRVARQEGESPEAARGALLDALRESELPRALGLVVTSPLERSLDATSGGTGAEFGMLFVSMSFFLIASAALLVALTFGLQLDRRVREAGVLLAQGFTPVEVRRLFLVEGLLVAAVGALVGLGLALGYAALLLEGLRTLWWDAIRIPLLVLAVKPASVAAGYFGTCAVVFLSIWVASRRLRTRSVRSMLSGVPLSSASGGSGAGGRPLKSIVVGAVMLSFAVALAGGALGGFVLMVAAFFGTGVCALVGCLAFLSAWLHSPARGARGRPPGVTAVGVRNAGRAPGRSLLTASLVASATFLIVAVAASQSDPTAERPQRDSGNGGFALAASTDVAITHALDSEAGREELGLANLFLPIDPDDPGAGERPVDWSGMSTYAFRVRPGDHASCLNLYAPPEPRILGVPRGLIERGGFAFASAMDASGEESPWALLDRTFDDGAIPVIGDANTMTWILKKAIGDDIVVRGDSGDELVLRLVATLSRSIFQGELLMSEERFLELFPTIDGARFFLVELPEEARDERVETIERALELGLGDFGFDAIGTNALIASFLSVERTYISIFRLLGGLGLLLGTVGLGVVLLRGVLERRGELGLLQAMGFRKRSLSWMVLAEDVVLLAAGMATGLGAALLGLLVRIGEPGTSVPWGELAAILALVFAVGLASALAAVRAALRVPLLAALRGE